MAVMTMTIRVLVGSQVGAVVRWNLLRGRDFPYDPRLHEIHGNHRPGNGTWHVGSFAHREHIVCPGLGGFDEQVVFHASSTVAFGHTALDFPGLQQSRAKVRDTGRAKS